MLRAMRASLGVSRLLAPALAQQPKASPEQRAARYLDSVRAQHGLLLAFLRQMPKGGDLHNHLGGAIYAESLIDFAAEDGLCVDRTTSALIAPPCDSSCEHFTSKPAIRCAYGDQVLHDSIIDAWSMRNWMPGQESGHDHFFATFGKFGLALTNHIGDALAEATSRAAEDHVDLLELMNSADGSVASDMGHSVGWNDDFAAMREKLLAAGMKEAVAATRKKLDSDEARMRADLKCGTAAADPGCLVTVRYLYQVRRGLSPERVFAQILLGFELASADPRFVGFNLVMPEDAYVPMRDFDLHMRIIDYLHGFYPAVHVSLHAGELAMGLVPPEGLRFHIRESVDKGHAERIGHGVDVMDETDSVGLLKEMAAKHVLVEICLTSNDLILGVSGKEHPFSVYRKYGVPVALATDDEGVSRIDMTSEYVRAVETYDLKYADLKQMARQSLEHSFVPGTSLWDDKFLLVRACAADRPGGEPRTRAGGELLNASERARLQGKLEGDFAAFEKKF